MIIKQAFVLRIMVIKLHVALNFMLTSNGVASGLQSITLVPKKLLVYKFI